VFEFTLFIQNEGSQRLTHAEVGYGSLAVDQAGAGDSLPAGATIFSATLNGAPCFITEDLLGSLCDLGQFDSGETATVQVIVNAPDDPGAAFTYASFKVAENVPDQGANRNTFFANSNNFVVAPTNSNSNATYKLAGETFSLSTAGQTLVKKDSMTTTVSGPAGAGAISISEEDCDNSCTGQIATVHVRDGAVQTPYLLWTLVVTGQLGDPIIVTHELDNGTVELISESNSCDTDTETGCMVSVTEQGNVTTLVFRTETNGKVRAN
jgi:hypothetical protein